MPKFDRVDGVFVVTHITYEERLIFQRNGWSVKLVDGKKRWTTTSVEKARALREHAVGEAAEHLDNFELIRNAKVEASWAEDSDVDVPAPEGLTYMPFQRAGIAYAMDRPRTLVADPPGLGKTIQAIGTHNARKCNKVLVVCPASLKVNWSREWRRWDVHGLTVGIAMSVPKREPLYDEDGERLRDHNDRPAYRGWTEHNWPDTDVVIVNYDMLIAFDEEIKAQKWDMAIYDEAHLLKTATAIRTICVFGGKKKQRKQDGKVVEKARTLQPIVASRHLYLTGTPILSKPVELWTLLKACDPKGLGKNWERFVYQYCGAYEEFIGDNEKIVTDGSSNLDELNRFMRERFMVRRDKQAVLKELPPKTRELIMLPKDKLETPIKKEKTRVEKALEAFEGMLGVDSSAGGFRYIDTIEAISAKLSAALEAQDSEEPDWNAAVKTMSEPEQIAFTELSEAREEVALAKVGLVTEHVKKLVECDEPVILFAYHKSVIEELKERLEKSGIRVGIVTGKVPPKKRQVIVDSFQNGEIDVIIGNILAMGVGFTLTRARFVVFAELDWVPAMIEQAEDRAWRHGQDCAVIVQHLVVDGSIEARMAIALLVKMGVIYEALDGDYS